VPSSSDGKRPKIQGISFEVQAGEVMAFMMTSGNKKKYCFINYYTIIFVIFLFIKYIYISFQNEKEKLF
jgi:ABC-type transport system involved in Fe-S cluster assembly fused permease/ATPase subunit